MQCCAEVRHAACGKQARRGNTHTRQRSAMGAENLAKKKSPRTPALHNSMPWRTASAVEPEGTNLISQNTTHSMKGRVGAGRTPAHAVHAVRREGRAKKKGPPSGKMGAHTPHDAGVRGVKQHHPHRRRAGNTEVYNIEPQTRSLRCERGSNNQPPQQTAG